MDEKTLLERIKRCDFTSCNQKEIREIAVGIIEEIENIKKTLIVCGADMRNEENETD